MSEQHPGSLGNYSSPDVDIQIVEDLIKGVYGKIEWQYDREEGGHVWQRGYIGNQLVVIRCARCGLTPLHVMREDLSIDTCRCEIIERSKPTMTLHIFVSTTQANGYFDVEAPTIPEAFALIPTRAAELGYGLLNDGAPVEYVVTCVK